MMSDHNSSDLAPQRQEIQNVVPTAEKTDSSHQELEFLFSPLIEEYYTLAHGHAEENNNDQASNASFQEAEFINPFYTRQTEDTTPRYNNDNQSGQFGNQRTMTVARTRETVGSLPKVLKILLSQGQMMMCKQAEQGVPLQAEQADWLADTDEEIDEQELEAHYSFMAKIQEVLLEESSQTETPLEQLNETLGLLARKDIDIKEGQLKEKSKVISDLKVKEEKDIDKMIEMDKQLKFLNEIVYTRNQSIQTIHMLAPKCSTYNGRRTFANLKYLKKPQSEKPYLYEIPYDTSDLANRFAPNREETMTLANESRSKLNKDYVKPYDYTKQNSLYEIFKAPLLEYLYQLERSKEVKKTMWRKTDLKAQMSKLTTSVSSPSLSAIKLKDKAVPLPYSQVKFKKKEVEDHHRISSISKKTKSVTACNDKFKFQNFEYIKFIRDQFAKFHRPLISIADCNLILFIVDSGCTKHMTGNLKLLCNFVEKFLGTVRFGNDQFALILGYGDLNQGNITIKRVYYF
ncbi:hypothetical protein Tco_0680116 [Tanacetum coccineum]|uniref:Retrovirus-related Pol polyprotein from transposon TNT 1-94-like beta-barrel domain-containing protein n=1 Tax=Tanacetum coccineum TaxID=301880 RepID=A0ABQ4XJR4_9ASTR